MATLCPVITCSATFTLPKLPTPATNRLRKCSGEKESRGFYQESSPIDSSRGKILRMLLLIGPPVPDGMPLLLQHPGLLSGSTSFVSRSDVLT